MRPTLLPGIAARRPHRARVALLLAALGAVAFARPAAAACTLAIPDNPLCGCAAAGGEWPTAMDQDHLLPVARRSLVTQTSCLRHGGQPYWQMQLYIGSAQDADFLAGVDPGIVTDFPRQAWCTETVAYWHWMALMPYLTGYANPEWHPSAYVRNARQLRAWYRTEEDLRSEGKGGRGRWIGGSELDYAHFLPGVNGPCPGAYQAHEAWDSVGGQWADSCFHSQVVDSMVVWRIGNATGPVTAVDVHVIEGNAGGGTFVNVNGLQVNRGTTQNTKWYRNVIDYTRLGTQTTGCGGRKIRGWGIDLHEDGTTYCESGRITTIVTPYAIAFPAPIGPDNPDSSTVNLIVGYVLDRPGPVLVTGNAAQVVTGGALPGQGNHWLIPPGPLGVDPVYVQVDLRAEHPLPVEGLVLEWKGGVVPSQYTVMWGGDSGGPMSRTFAPATGGGSPDPSQRVPIPMRFGPAANYAVRYLRVAIPASALTRPFEIAGLHLLFDYGEDDDNGDVDDAPATAGVGEYGPAGSTLRLAPGVPNPFDARTAIAFDLPASAAVEVAIHDVAGRRVRSLPGEVFPAGRHQVEWDGLDDAGHRARVGAYFVEVRAGGERGVRRVVLLR